MKDYVLVFTEGADLYNLEKQLKNFSESKIVKIDGKEDFASLDYCINEAASLGYDSFHFISSFNDWAALDESINEEYGHLIETKVVPAIFHRKFTEADTQNVSSVITNWSQLPKAPYLISISPFNLLNFNKNGTSEVKEKVDFLEGLRKTVVKNEQVLAKQRYFPIIPSSDMAIYGKAGIGITADEALSIAKECESNITYKNSLDKFFANSALIEERQPTQQNEATITQNDMCPSARIQVKLSEQNFVDTVLQRLGLFLLKTGDTQQNTKVAERPVVFLGEEDAINIISKQHSQGKLPVYFAKFPSKAGHFNSNMQFAEKLRQANSRIKPISDFSSEEATRLANEDFAFSGARSFDNVDNYLFQILMVNNWNINNNVNIDARQFTTNIIQNINAQQGWKTIGEFLSKGLLIDQLQADVKDTWADWLISGGKHVAKMATNAGGYRDEKLAQRANMMAAISGDPSKVPHPSDGKYYQIEDKTFTEKEFKALPKEQQSQAKEIGFGALPQEKQKLLLDNYKKKIDSMTAGVNSLLKQQVNSRVAGMRKNDWYSTQGHQIADRVSREEKLKQAEKAFNQCKILLDQDRNSDGNYLSPEKKRQVLQLAQDSQSLINNIKGTDRHDYSEDDGTNLNLYNQMLDNAEKLGISSLSARTISNSISKEQAVTNKQGLVNKKQNQQKLEPSEEEQLVLYNQFVKQDEYGQLRQLLLS